MTLLQRVIAQQREKIESYLNESAVVGIVYIDPKLNILDCNHGFTNMFQLNQKPLGSPVSDFLIFGNGALRHGEELKFSCSHLSGARGILYCHAIETESGILLFCERLMLTESRAVEQIGALNNDLISLQREEVRKNLLLEKLRRELDDHIAELESALSRVKQLEGIIPICSYCKKIRDDQDLWHEVEKYITVHPEARFSHGICPDCLEKEMEKMEP